MKRINLFILVIATIWVALACENSNVNPALKLDNMFLPEGYIQADPTSSEAGAYLDELRLKNPSDHFYYLKLADGPVTDFKKVLFPQKELKIEYVDNNLEKKNISGVIVKRITGKFEDEHFTIVDNGPEPVGGMKNLYTYIQQNLKYPEQARKMGIEGRVFVQFVVSKDGSLTDVQAIKGIGANCDQEAVKVLKNAPRWKPGSIAGKNVGVRMILPITFRLD